MMHKSLLLGLALLIQASALAADEDRSREGVRKKLAAITAAPGKKPADAATADRESALRRLNAYRFLAGVASDVTLDEDLTATALAGAKLCAKIGRLDHKPANPGLPEEEYKKGYEGTSKSSLGYGFRSLEMAVDYWMDDSDKLNIAQLGHRRWCLNPAMQKVGFGRAGAFSAMYCADQSRKPVPDYDFVCWPGRGPMPVEYFKPRQAWSVTLNPRKYAPPGAAVKPTIYELDRDGKPGEALKLDHTSVDTLPFAVANCISFRPAALKLAPGKRYRVEIAGVAPQAGEEAPPVRFEVEFITLK